VPTRSARVPIGIDQEKTREDAVLKKIITIGIYSNPLNLKEKPSRPKRKKSLW